MKSVFLFFFEMYFSGAKVDIWNFGFEITETRKAKLQKAHQVNPNKN